MIRHLPILLGAILSFLFLLPKAAPANAQDVVTTDPLKSVPQESKEPVPPVPEKHLLDAAAILTTAEQAELSQKLTDFQKQGFFVYVATFTYIYGEDANQRAVRLAEKWLPGRNGAVLVYDKGGDGKTYALGVACAQDDSRPFTTEMLLRVAHSAPNAAKTGSKAQGQVKNAAAAVMEEFAKLAPVLAESRRILSSTQWKIAGLVLGAMVACLLLLMMAQRFQKSAERRAADVLLFPEIEVSQRYGAQFGGGVVVQMEFSNYTPKAS